MSSYWQEIIVAAIVLAAASYLAQQLWHVREPQTNRRMRSRLQPMPHGR